MGASGDRFECLTSGNVNKLMQTRAQARDGTYEGLESACEFDDGLTGYDGEEFFLQVLRHKGLRKPEVQFCYPFLWYFQAIPAEGRTEWTASHPPVTGCPL